MSGRANQERRSVADVKRNCSGDKILLSDQHQELGSNLGPFTAEHRVKPWSETQNQAKRINNIGYRLLLRDQGVGGSNPLSPTNLIENKYFATYESWNESLARHQGGFGATRTHLSEGVNELSRGLGSHFCAGTYKKDLHFSILNSLGCNTTPIGVTLSSVRWGTRSNR